ncbi:MAG: GNAT family N-acetyltransferase [Flavobacteriales bacterium]|nr:GNAT family N-acetyltransferase [Flavobacteriales bacterium]
MLHIKTWEELSKEELYAILRLRQQVFILEQVCPFVDNDNFDQESIHVWAEQEGEVTAYGRIVPQGTEFNELSVGRFVTADGHRGKGLGREIVQACLDEAFRRYGKQSVKITAQWVYVDFYRSFGFETVGEEFHLDHIPHIYMILE